MNKDNGGLAFPVPVGVTEGMWTGMTLRDYFAAKAMLFNVESFEEIAGISHKAGEDHRDGFRIAAAFAYQIADAMLEARGGGKKEEEVSQRTK